MAERKTEVVPAASATGWAGIWRRAQRGWPADFPIVQFPNAPLLVFMAAAVLERVCSGRAHEIAWAVGRVALTIWAYEEVARPANWFRRVLGIAVLVLVVFGLANELG